MVWNTDLIETMEFENLIGQAAQNPYSDETRNESRGMHGSRRFPNVQWMKHVKEVQVVLEYQEVIDHLLDDQMNHVSSAKRVY